MVNWRRGIAIVAASAALSIAPYVELAAPAYITGLFPQQAAFVADASKKKCALCSRRSGKTEAVAAWLLEGGYSCPGGLSVYIARSRANARLILWNTLIRIN